MNLWHTASIDHLGFLLSTIIVMDFQPKYPQPFSLREAIQLEPGVIADGMPPLSCARDDAFFGLAAHTHT